MDGRSALKSLGPDDRTRAAGAIRAAREAVALEALDLEEGAKRGELLEIIGGLLILEGRYERLKAV